MANADSSIGADVDAMAFALPGSSSSGEQAPTRAGDAVTMDHSLSLGPLPREFEDLNVFPSKK